MNVKEAVRSAWYYSERARPSIVFFVAVIIALQILGAALITPELSMGKGFHVSDASITAITFILQTWICLGLARTALNVAEDRPVTIWHLFALDGVTFRALLVTTLVGFSFGLGLLLLIIPGLYLLLSWSQAYWLILDNRARLFDALAFSKSLTHGHKWKLLGAYLLMGVFGISGRVIETLGTKALETGRGGGAFAVTLLGSIWSIVYFAMSTFVGVALYLQLRQQWLNREIDPHQTSLAKSAIVGNKGLASAVMPSFRQDIERPA